MAAGSRVDGQSFGGISALAYRHEPRELLALCDGRRQHGPARLFVLDADTLKPRRVQLLTAFAGEQPDLEGLALLPDGTLLVSTEGDGKPRPRVPPGVWQLSGTKRQAVPVPEAFLPEPTGEQTRGVRHNKGFEGLTASRFASTVVVAAEQALVQDGPVADFERGTKVRMVVYDGGLQIAAERRYLTDPLRRSAREGEVQAFELGVSALALYDDTRLLVMERGGQKIAGIFETQVRIYEVLLTEEAEVLTKRLVLDFADLTLAGGPVDNYEAMAFWLRDDGEGRLYVASDDNFSSKQRTSLLTFAVR